MVAESPLEVESAVRRTVGANMEEQLLNIPRWRGFNNPWMAEDDQDVDFSYINLVDNPERYTGYKVLRPPQTCRCLLSASNPLCQLHCAAFASPVVPGMLWKQTSLLMRL